MKSALGSAETDQLKGVSHYAQIRISDAESEQTGERQPSKWLSPELSTGAARHVYAREAERTGARGTHSQ
jgi:hypothetical protein